MLSSVGLDVRQNSFVTHHVNVLLFICCIMTNDVAVKYKELNRHTRLVVHISVADAELYEVMKGTVMTGPSYEAGGSRLSGRQSTSFLRLCSACTNLCLS